MKNKKTLIWGIIILIAIIGLMVWGRSGYETTAGYFEDTDVLCLPAGHANLGQHIHPDLEIGVDGVPEEIPANIGVTAECMAEVHTHDSTGEIHLETVSPSKEMTLGDFFEVWGQAIERDGLEAKVTINGQEVLEPEGMILGDHDRIKIEYTTLSSNNENGSQKIETGIDEGASALGVKVVPLEVLEDSRCPIGVECIVAGTVRVRALLSSGLGTAEQIFTLGEVITTETEEVALIDVKPKAILLNESIETAEYRFIFEIKKREDI
jgi:hypothetical protein